MKEFLDYCENTLQNVTECECPGIESVNEYFGISPLPKNPVTTMAYVPFQTNTTMYDIETGFKNGTIFTDLNKPFLGGCCI